MYTNYFQTVSSAFIREPDSSGGLENLTFIESDVADKVYMEYLWSFLAR
jgi:hypothetical protein